MNNSFGKVLITGSNGLLGQKLVSICLDKGIDFMASSKGINRNTDLVNARYTEMDICSAEQIKKAINNFKPDYLIHTAAITNVDYCELNPDECVQANVLASKLLFDQCKSHNIHFQLLSTDFVFDGEKGDYLEEDEVNPLSIYAQSKVDAENMVLKK